jgi:large repetitive protein
MKAIVYALMAGIALTSSQWGVPDTLPQCYTGLPFNLELSNSNAASYSYSSADLPSWASLDAKKGVISGSSQSAGAWPINVKVSDAKSSVNKQYILNVVDVTAAGNDVWASEKSTSYYERKVDKPLRVIPSKTDSTIVSKGKAFSYRFGSENAVGSTVYAFLNLPEGISGDAKTGALSGAFTVPGIYTLGVESADQSGNTA